MKKHKLPIMVLFCGIAACSFGQEASTAAGGDASGSGGSVAYSVGQVVYTSISGTNGNLNQGVQQPYDVLTTSVDDASTELSLSFFPNPVQNSLQIQIKDFAGETFSYSLFDSQGKLLESKCISSAQSQLEMSTYASGNYFVSVYKNKQQVRSFKIIKK